jgi:hypothetical protein
MTINIADAQIIYSGHAKLKSLTEPIRKTSYIHPYDLDEVLSMYFNNELDFVDPVNCCKGLSALVPGNTLASQLDQNDMAYALGELDRSNVLVLTYYQGYDDRLASKDYAEALSKLSEVVLAML